MKDLQRIVVGLTLIVAATFAHAQNPEPAEKPKVEEVMVVTASRIERLVHDVPAAVSVITAADLAQMPVENYGEILRSVPGLNVTQISARDIQVTARAATTSLAATQLVLLDGRSVYLDFFGFVMWDFLPVDVSEIKQIEAVRGPGSAVWGANAMSGVINVITKRPKEMRGISLIVGGGNRGTLLGSATYAGYRERLGYKVSAGYYRQDAFDRPGGVIRGTSTTFPDFDNEGTEQMKGDVRTDYDVSDATNVSLSAGYATTDGLVHSGLGPFDMKRGSSMSYVKADWSRRAMRGGVFANFLDADSTSLLAVGVNGRPIAFGFKTNTFNADASHTTVLRDRHIVTYGATARHNAFKLSIAPGGRGRDEFGAFAQDEIASGRLRLVAGARWDHIDPIGTVVSPRAAILFSPLPRHTVRMSFGRAFRAPSVVNHFLDTAILTVVALPTGPFAFATQAVGNTTLSEERLDAFEVGYAATPRSTVVLSATVYRNKTAGLTDFYASRYYSSSNPPAGWPLPVQFLDAPPLRNSLPAAFSYRNVGEVVNKGVELAANTRAMAGWSWFANYSYQTEPAVRGIPSNEVNVPPSHRANLGAGWDRGTWFVNANVNYQSEAVWTDVLDARYWGTTDGFASVNAAAGVRLSSRTKVSITSTNVFDEPIQQHVFGDVIGRKVIARLQFKY
jgi:iron complex outermembrane receptor protein